MTYKIYSTAHDEIVRGVDLLNGNESGTLTPWDMDEAMAADAAISRLPQMGMWDIPEGDSPLRFLIDCSGSMRGIPMVTVVAALRKLGDELTIEGRPFEILGYTTATWKGGEPRKAFIAQRNIDYQDENFNGYEEGPGRLNALRHIVIKGMEEDWDEVGRPSLIGLLRSGMLKENIDGEALLWTRDRMRNDAKPAGLIVISDGVPIDDSTLSQNPSDFLANHLAEVLADFEKDGVVIQAVAMNAHERFPIAYPDPVIVKDPRRRSDMGERYDVQWGNALFQGIVNAIHRVDQKLTPSAGPEF